MFVELSVFSDEAAKNLHRHADGHRGSSSGNLLVHADNIDPTARLSYVKQLLLGSHWCIDKTRRSKQCTCKHISVELESETWALPTARPWLGLRVAAKA